MKRIKESKKEQGVLFAEHYVGDRLPKNDEVYLFEQVFDQLDIRKITDSYSREGGSMFNPKDQLAVIIFAYYKGITSSVKIAEYIRYNLQFMYLAGGHIISRRTICDFRVKHFDAIRELLKSSVNIAVEAGLVSDSDSYALDGSKIEANASFSKTRRKKEWKERQKKIIDHVDRFLREWEEQDRLEEGLEEEQEERFRRISEKLKNIKKQNQEKGTRDSEEDHKKDDLKKETTEESDKLSKFSKNRIKIKDATFAEKYLDEHTKIDSLLDKYKDVRDDMFLNLSDSDCRVMKNDKKIKESYNVQAVSNNQIIVALDVTQDENDQSQLEPMIEQLKQNVNFKKLIRMLTDAGYNRGKNLEYISNESQIDAYISMNDRSENKNSDDNFFHKENFKYDESDNSWICPTGERLEFKNEFRRDNKKQKLYACKLEKCIYCSERKSCIKTGADTRRGYRTIEDDGYVVHRKKMKEKMQYEESKEIYSRRSAEIESVFGQIKNNRNFSRFRLRGLGKVRIESTIMAISHNLGKIMKYMAGKNEMAECHA